MTTRVPHARADRDPTLRLAVTSVVGLVVTFLVLTWIKGPLNVRPGDLSTAWTIIFGVPGAWMAYQRGMSLVGGALLAISLGPLGLRYIRRVPAIA